MRWKRKLRYQIRQIENKTVKCVKWEDWKKELFEEDPYLEPYLNDEITHKEYCEIVDIIEDRKKRLKKFRKKAKKYLTFR